MKRYLVIDGGTTNLRVTLADAFGQPLATERRSVGAAATAVAGSNAALRSAVRDCMEALYRSNGFSAADVSGCIAYGMITSASGLMEIPHLCAPAGLEDFRRNLVSQRFEDIAPFPITFIPGLRNFSGEVRLDNLLRMDMMRGEETEALGFAQLVQPPEDYVLVLPGNHSKLISATREGTLRGCMTTIAGELLSALTHHTILTDAVGGSFAQPETYDREFMLAGANACASGFSRAAFSARILRTLGGVPQEKAASFLLGAVLAADAEALKAFDVPCERLYVAGKEPLQRALCDLLSARGYSAVPVDAAVTARIGVVGAMTIADFFGKNARFVIQSTQNVVYNIHQAKSMAFEGDSIMNTKALYNITYGLYLLSAQLDGKDNACIINTAAQVANEPTRIAISVIQKNLTHDMVKASGRFSLSAITTDAPFSLFQRFGMQSGRDADKFAGFDGAVRGEDGLYHLTDHANAWFTCKVVDSMDLGSHTLFIAELTDAEVLSKAASCTYGYYQSDIKPKPAAAPKKGWVCSVCGYVYEGDEVPDDFICPLCKHGKEVFQPVGAAPAEAKAEPVGEGKKWKCTVCGEVVVGDRPPEKCPLCQQPAEKFVEVIEEGEKTWAAEHVVGVAEGSVEEVMEGLRANFTGECTEVGMYLAMARVAHREGYPEIGKYWEKAGKEEAEHAAKFAELLGEVVTDSTKKNLEMRVEAENGATLGKYQLAMRARELGYDAIADTVMEMAKDEARHGKALEGLLKRNFGK